MPRGAKITEEEGRASRQKKTRNRSAWARYVYGSGKLPKTEAYYYKHFGGWSQERLRFTTTRGRCLILQQLWDDTDYVYIHNFTVDGREPDTLPILYIVPSEYINHADEWVDMCFRNVDLSRTWRINPTEKFHGNKPFCTRLEWGESIWVMPAKPRMAKENIEELKGQILYGVPIVAMEVEHQEELHYRPRWYLYRLKTKPGDLVADDRGEGLSEDDLI